MKTSRTWPKLKVFLAVFGLAAAMRFIMAEDSCMPSDFGCTSVIVTLGNATWGQGDCPPGSTFSPDPNDIPMMCHKCDSVSGGAGGSGILGSFGTDTNGNCVTLETGVCASVSVDLGGTECDYTNYNGLMTFSNPKHSGVIQVKSILQATCMACPTNPDPPITNICTQCWFQNYTWQATGYIEVQLPPDEEDGGSCGGSGCANTAADSGSGPSCSSCGGGGGDNQFGGTCAANDSVNFRLNLGRSTPLKNAGYLWLYAQTPSSALSTPAALAVPFNRPGVQIL